MLGVVDQDQRPAAREPSGERVHERAILLAHHAERVSDQRQHECCVAKRSERDPPRAVRECIRRFGCRLQCEAAFPRSARAGERQQARPAAAQQADDLRKLVLAAEERRRRHRQVRVPEAPERREHGPAELVQVLGCGEILQTVLADIAERETR